MSPLLRELVAAHRTARRPELAPTLQACGLPINGDEISSPCQLAAPESQISPSGQVDKLNELAAPVPVWGVAFVDIDTHHYAPAAGGRPAIICPLFADGVLLDLVATGLGTRSTRTRAGVATVLGQEWINRAKDTETAVRLFSDPIEWLRNGCRGAVVVDWRAARYALADVPGIACEGELLAKRVEQALKQPVSLPRLFVREARRAA